MVVTLIALWHPCTATAASDGASFRVTVTVLPTRAQTLRKAQISVRQADDTVLVLTDAQQAEYIRDPSSIQRYVRPDGTRPTVVTVCF